MLSDLCPANAAQADLFDPETKPDNPALMQVIDHINQSGKGRIFLARQGMRKDWAMKQQFLSPRYTTRWADIPIVK
jgi:DNA polymerase V